MQLITILLYVVAILAALSGWAVFIGARKDDKFHASHFLLATIGASLWTIGIATFISLKPEHSNIAPVIIIGGIYISPLLMDIGMISFICWKYGLGKAISVIFTIMSVGIASLMLYNPALIYSKYEIASKGNSVMLADGWFSLFYAGFIIAGTSIMLIFLLYQTLKARSKNMRSGNLFFLIALSIAGVLSLIFDIVMPLVGRYDIIWPGPLGMAVTVIAIYYAILRYRMMQLAASWLKVLSYVILMTSAAIVYMVIFFIIFTALFKIPNPSASIFILNFIMIVIVLLLMPVLNELSAFINSLINTGQVDLGYVVKKLNHIATHVNLNELADFLADHLHFSYIGFLIDGRLYGSSALALSTSEIREVSKLKTPEKGIWQEFNEPVSEAFHRVDINAVAQLNNAKGKPFGQILVGKPQGKMSFEHRDLIQLEMIINLVAAVIDTKA